MVGRVSEEEKLSFQALASPGLLEWLPLEQTQVGVEPLVSFVETCAILFSVLHYTQITKLQINPL